MSPYTNRYLIATPTSRKLRPLGQEKNLEPTPNSFYRLSKSFHKVFSSPSFISRSRVQLTSLVTYCTYVRRRRNIVTYSLVEFFRHRFPIKRDGFRDLSIFFASVPRRFRRYLLHNESFSDFRLHSIQSSRFVFRSFDSNRSPISFYGLLFFCFRF